MKSIIRNLRMALRDPQDYTARSNLMWASALSAVLGKQKDERCVPGLSTGSHCQVQSWQRDGRAVPGVSALYLCEGHGAVCPFRRKAIGR